MPGQVKTSGLMAKLGNRLDQAVQNHAGDEANYGFVRLPGGIANGVAQLSECGFKQYEAGTPMKKADGSSAVGEWYFSARGIIQEPEYVDVPGGSRMKVAGLQTSVMENMFDTKNSDGKVVGLDEHVATVLNHIRILGVDTSGASGAELESLCQTAVELAPYFHFSTELGKATEKYPNPRVFERWNGVKGLEEYVAPDFEAAATVDGTGAGPKPSANGNGVAQPPARGRAVATAAPEPEPQGSDDGGGSDFQLIELVEQASIAVGPKTAATTKQSIAAAQQQLTDLATQAGASAEQIDAAQSWQEVADLITSAGGDSPDISDEQGGEPDASGEPAAVEWEKGESCLYQLVDKAGKPILDPKSKKPRKPITCEVVAVDNKAGTATLKSMVDGKTLYKGVPMTSLIIPE